MQSNYMYCKNDGSCLHRRGCRKWLGNYKDDAVAEESAQNTLGYIEDGKCLNIDDSIVEVLEDGTEWYPRFTELDRFRLSDGSEFQ